MNLSESKENFIYALGLRRLTEHEKMLRNNANKADENTIEHTLKPRKRPLRRPRILNRMKNELHVIQFSPDGKKTKTTRGGLESKSPRTAPPTSRNKVMNAPITNVVAASSQVTTNNLILLPPQPKGQQAIQSQTGILLGQTILQGPDGKRFILIPSTTSKQNTPAVVQISQCKTPSSIPQPILPVSGNLKIKTSSEAGAPQGYLYLPQGVLANNAATMGTGNVVTNVTNVLPGCKVVVSLAQNPGAASYVNQPNASPANTTSNIMQLLNMTRSALSETQFPASSFNIGVWPQNTNQTVQVMKIKPTDICQKEFSTLTDYSTSKATHSIYVQSKAMGSTLLPSSSLGLPIVSLSLTPNNAPTQVFLEAPKGTQNMNLTSPGSSFGATEKGNSSMAVHTLLTSPIKTGIKMVQPKIALPSLSSAKIDPSKSKPTTPEAHVSTIQSLLSENTEKHVGKDDVITSNKPLIRRMARYIGDPSKNVHNPETNCVVIQGKRRKKKGDLRSINSPQHRRYGGPPFVPCKPPPVPNTPSSGTCCLYEHTLLKMATRGFWGCEMGQLQDVFRSIRSESIDLDTVEDVTKRCYGFVRRKLIDTGEDNKSTYRYMKNYIEEFDSFLDRVYPVAIIAILIYLPTASDYSVVTWHGIPPTGWSEYRRAVVMREVFEVVYRFGTETGTIPEYQREFFDSPVKSPLLVPRVFDLRQNYADPTTCVVHKVPKAEKVGSDEKLKSVSDACPETDKDLNYASNIVESEMETQKLDCTSEVITEVICNAEVESSKTGEANMLLSCDSGKETNIVADNKSKRTDLIESAIAVDQRKRQVLVSQGFESNDAVFETTKPEKVNHNKGVVEVQGNNSQKEVLCEAETRQIQDLKEKVEAGLKPADCCKHVIYSEDVNVIDQVVFPRDDSKTKAKLSDYYQYSEFASRNLIVNNSDDRMSPVYDRNGNKVPQLCPKLQSASPLGDESANLVASENAKPDKPTENQMVISAGFAESIVAACENNQPWMKVISNQKQCSTTPDNEFPGNNVDIDEDGQNLDLTKSLQTVSSSKKLRPTLAASLLETEEMMEPTQARRTYSFADSSEVNESQAYSDHENSNCSDTSGMHPRRTSRRLANSTRFDILTASDEISLERDLRKAIKLSKQQSFSSSRSNSISNLSDNSNLVPGDKKLDKIPLKNTLKPFHVDNFALKDASDNPIAKLKKINRSVAFEALWTQMSVEEPTVILDEKTYSLGEFLEKFPVETHCPPERTVMKIYKQEYNARDILGYLRRGNQLVEQIDNEVVIDTTRTVKTNSVILAVRKVPPGKISKLVHPDLHLENYTGYLLPLGTKQPVKVKKNTGRSALRLKRKSSLCKEESAIKSEPTSPSVYNSPSQQQEQEFATPPLQKLMKMDSIEEGMIMERTDQETEVKVASECKEVQTDEQDSRGQFGRLEITDVDSLEKALNSFIESAMAGLAETEVIKGNQSTSEDLFQTMIGSYERAGNFLLNTAKMLKNIRDHRRDREFMVARPPRVLQSSGK